MIEIVRRLKALKRDWQELGVTPRNLAALGMPGKDSSFIEETIDRLADMATELTPAPAGSLTMVQRSCEDQLKHLEAFCAIRGADIPSMRMLSFITLLLQMQSLLRSALAQSINHPDHQNPTSKTA